MSIEFDIDHFLCYFTDENIEVLVERDKLERFNFDDIISCDRIYFTYFDNEANLNNTRNEVSKIHQIHKHLIDCYLDMFIHLEYRVIPATTNLTRDYYFPYYISIGNKKNIIDKRRIFYVR